ncbi:YciI family protein [Phenylobacterium sp. J367]|uniref:YciI family protein n=1 Tax=Phenylobacterium sp. J367 TaxID=2898435 RepID=UPI002150F1B9|nr:YciI family protein [Phenylobacterium sp. J367]MCR5877431.1 YciI family protein [Phenylobacterium sp. J367]
MKYLMLIYEPENVYEGAEGEKALMEIVGRHMQLGEALRAQGVSYIGAPLQPTSSATTVATGEGGVQTLHDGPFAETREHLGGYYEMELKDLDEAIHWARQIPVMPGGKIEVRPHADYA